MFIMSVRLDAAYSVGEVSERLAAGLQLDPANEAAAVSAGSVEKPSDQAYHELVRRLQPDELEVLNVKMASTTEPGTVEVADFLSKSGAFSDMDLRERIFSDEMSPYHVLRAFREGLISLDQFSTFQIHYHMMEHRKEKLEVISLFLSDGSRNPKAEALVKSSVSDKTVGEFATPSPPMPFTITGINPTESQIDEIFDKARLLPPSERVLLSFPDMQEERITMMEGALKVPKTISQATAQTGLTFLNRACVGDGDDARVVRLKPSVGLMKLAVDVVRDKDSSFQIHPVLGLSSREDICAGQEASLRDMAIPFPGIELPETADGFKAPLIDGDFTDHDFYHAMVLAHVPDDYARLYLEIYKALPGYNGQGSKAAQDLADNFLDLEFPGARLVGLDRLEDRFWLGILMRLDILYLEVIGRTPEMLAKLGLDLSDMPVRFDLLDDDAMSASLEQVGCTIREKAEGSLNSADFLTESIMGLAFLLSTRSTALFMPREQKDHLRFKLRAIESILKGWESGAP